jgi:hypothetical protein
MSTITLQDKNAANAVYSAYRTEGNRSVYIGGSHSDKMKDQVVISSSTPKRSASSYGNRRSSLNLVRSVTVDTPDGGTETKDAKIELVISLPVGITASDVDELFARIVSVPEANFDSFALLGQTQL